MACYHPLKAFQIGHHEKSGKPKYMITSYDVEGVYFNREYKKWIKAYPNTVLSHSNDLIRDFIEVPCGNCIGCRLKYSRDWATRCMLEAKEHESNYFVTLTYEDSFLHNREYMDNETGEIKDISTLEKRDFQLFMKRLRKNYKYNNSLRFFASGEYGSLNARPHYHAIIFGLKLDDLKVYKKSSQGFTYYTSEFLSKCWHNKGYVIVTEISFDTCAYVARYVMKKKKGEQKTFYSDFNIEPEFSLMSRRPGIARSYFEENKKHIYDYDSIIYSTDRGGMKVRPPRYFDKLMNEELPEVFGKVSENRKASAIALKEAKLKNTSLSYTELLEREEFYKKNSIKALKRVL